MPIEQCQSATLILILFVCLIFLILQGVNCSIEISIKRKEKRQSETALSQQSLFAIPSPENLEPNEAHLRLRRRYSNATSEKLHVRVSPEKLSTN